MHSTFNKHLISPAASAEHLDGDISDARSSCASLSDMSSLSGLTGYEEELYDLKKLLKQPSHHRKTAENTSVNASLLHTYEERIKKLNEELQNALKSNEKYKNEVFHVERKLELSYFEKTYEIVKRNSQLETQLSFANKHIRDLLQKDASSKDKCDYELVSKINLLENQVEHWKGETRTCEELNNRFSINLEQLKIELGTRENSIRGLKDKIAQQHVKMQNLISDNLKVNNSLAVTLNELNSFKQSEQWYKEQLSNCRKEKSNAANEITRLRSLIAAKNYDLNKLSSVLKEWQNKYTDEQEKLIKEKEVLSRKLVALQRDRSSQQRVIVYENPHESRLSIYEETIQSLTRELETIKEAVAEQQVCSHETNTQNSQLTARCATLQNTLNDKEILIDNLEIKRNEMSSELSLTNQRVKDMKAVLMKLFYEKSEALANLGVVNDEKSEIERVLDTIRENFSKLAENYSRIKQKLSITEDDAAEKRTECQELNEANRNLKYRLQEAAEANHKLNYKLPEAVVKVHDRKACGQVRRVIVAKLNRVFHKQRLLEENFHESQLVASAIKSGLEELQNVTKQVGLKEEQISSLTKANETFVENLEAARAFLDKYKARADELTQENELLHLENDKFRKIISNEQVKLIQNAEHEEIKRLKVICRAKESELKEKQRRYETANRTLLRKVKEHMRGRSATEKRYSYLQELYDNISNELNTLKLKHESREVEMRTLHDAYDNLKTLNDRLQQETQKRTDCDTRLQCSMLKEQLDVAQIDLYATRNELHSSKTVINDLRQELQASRLSKTNLQREIGKLKSNIDDVTEIVNSKTKQIEYLEAVNNNEQHTLAEIQAKLLDEQKQKSETTVRLADLENKFKLISERNRIVSEQLEEVTMKFKQDCMRLDVLQSERDRLEGELQQSDRFIAGLKSEAQDLQNELNATISEKQFLQRLCNDLKTTLRSFKESKENFTIELPSPSKYDETRIVELLKIASSTPVDDSVGNLKNSLDSLKKEMMCLRKQVTEKVLSNNTGNGLL